MRSFVLALGGLVFVFACSDADDASEALDADGASGDMDDCPRETLDSEDGVTDPTTHEARCGAATDVESCHAVYPSGEGEPACRSDDFVGLCDCGWVRTLTVSDPVGACEPIADDGGKCVPRVLLPYNDTCAQGERVGDCKSAWVVTTSSADVSPTGNIPVVIADTACSPPRLDSPAADCDNMPDDPHCACAASFLAETCGGT